MGRDFSSSLPLDRARILYRSPENEGIPSPSVSVVVPFYNDVRWIEGLLSSLAKVVAPNGGHEIVLVDDGSTDETPHLLTSLAPLLLDRVLIVRLENNVGRSVARNVGIHYARGDVIAFTDSDCLPAADWLLTALPHFRCEDLGIVQGQTLPEEGVHPTFFSHFMEVTNEDGHYATCNVLYRRSALLDAGGFDVEMGKTRSVLGVWEDVDMGLRVRRMGWATHYEEDALVYHRVIPVSPLRWVTWALHLGRRPDIAARYPEYREFLFRRYWIHPHHIWLTAALFGTLVAPLAPVALILWIPYLFMMSRRFGLSGRWPLLKWGLHVGWDLLGYGALLWRSLQMRKLVL